MGARTATVPIPRFIKVTVLNLMTSNPTDNWLNTFDLQFRELRPEFCTTSHISAKLQEIEWVRPAAPSRVRLKTHGLCDRRSVSRCAGVRARVPNSNSTN